MFGEVCYWCYWGWPKLIREVYHRARRDIEEVLEARSWKGSPRDGREALDYGPAHIVWEDENWDSVDFCITECDSERFSDWPPEILYIIRRSLVELKHLPAEIKVVPSGYDGVNPKKCPPPPHWEVVKKRETRNA